MSSPIDTDPKGGDGPNKGGAPGENSAAEAGEEQEQDEEGGEGDSTSQAGGRAEARGGVAAPKTASKGINPVQHSE